MREKISQLRKAAWHFRKGGVEQLKKWNLNRLAESAVPKTRDSLPDLDFFQKKRSLPESWKAFRQNQKTFLSAADVQPQPRSFPQGWVLLKEDSAELSSLPGTWLKKSFGRWNFFHDPDLEVNQLINAAGKKEVLLLGHAADSAEDLSSSSAVAPFLLRQIEMDETWQAFDSAVTWLGGRFIAIARNGDDLQVHVDAMASRSCYWASIDDTIVLASHSALVARIRGISSSSGCEWVLSHPDYINPAGKSLPGMITPHDEVKLVIANCVLSIEGNTAKHHRFFSTPPEKLSVVEATEHYLAELRFQMKAALELRPRSTLALTSGADSRAILTGTLDLLQQAGTQAMTYHFFARNADHSRIDLLGANRLALLSSLPHRILDVSAPATSKIFTSAYKETFPSWARFPSLARAYYENLGADESLILGIGGEVGTVFYRERDFDKITPAVLAGKFTQSEFQHDPRLIETIAEYLEYTELNEENSAGYDLFDLFYWEHRMSSWAAYGYSEADFGPLVVLPLNSRRIFHAMLSLPFKDRLQRSVYHQLATWSGIRG